MKDWKRIKRIAKTVKGIRVTPKIEREGSFTGKEKSRKGGIGKTKVIS